MASNDNEKTTEHPGYGSGQPEPEKRRLRWPIVVVASLLFVLLGGAFAAYAYDDSHKDEIADGVTIGGIDVGGVTAGQATAALQRKLVRPPQHPLRGKFKKHIYRLEAKKLPVNAELDSPVEP